MGRKALTAVLFVLVGLLACAAVAVSILCLGGLIAWPGRQASIVLLSLLLVVAVVLVMAAGTRGPAPEHEGPWSVFDFLPPWR